MVAMKLPPRAMPVISPPSDLAASAGADFPPFSIRMKACELFQKMPPALSAEIIAYLRQELREVYKATLITLAQQRKLRPQFVQKKPGAEQQAWIVETLRLRTSEAVAQQVLQVWLMKAQSPMLVTFLDELGLPHDGNGGIEEDIPKEIPGEKFRPAVDKLLATYPPEKVAVYLHVFQLQQPGGWPPLGEILATEPRLQLGA